MERETQNFFILSFVIISVVVPLLLFLLFVIFMGLVTMAAGFTELGGGLGLCIYVALWILALPIMAALALISGSITVWQSRKTPA